MSRCPNNQETMQLYGQEFDCLAPAPSDDIAASLNQLLEMVKAIDFTLDQVKKDSQALKNEVARVMNNVEELKADVQGLKKTLVDNAGNKPFQDSPRKSHVQTEIRKVVEEYSLNTNWDALKEGLERLLDDHSVEYHQLQSITDYSWGHLWQVGSRGYQDLAALLLDAGLPVNKKDNEGDAMIHGAAEGGKIELAQYLLERGADINLRGWRGLTPFNKAALGGNSEMTRWLANHGVDIHSADDNGMTSLHFAAEHGHLEIVWLLVHSGLNTKSKDMNEWTPLDWARTNRHAAVVGYLSGHLN